MPIETSSLIDRLYDSHQLVIRELRYREGLEPVAKDADFDDAAWPLDREFTRSRGRGNVMGWFRTTVEIPDRAGGFSVAGSPAHLLANIDDYGEIWIDGQIRAPIAGFNVDQRAQLSEQVRPGDRFSVAILAVNGYVAAPIGGIFIRYARVQFGALESVRVAAEALIEDLRRAERALRQAPQQAEAAGARLERAAAVLDWAAAGAGDKQGFIRSMAEARKALQ